MQTNKRAATLFILILSAIPGLRAAEAESGKGLFPGVGNAIPTIWAEDSEWKNVESLHQGDRVGVVQFDQKRVEGRFRSANDAGITIDVDGDRTIPKDSVARVYRRPGLTRSKRVLIGTAIGLAAGGAIAAGIGTNSNNEGFFGNGAAAGAAVAGGGGIGAAVGSLSGGGYKTIYRSLQRH